MFMRFLMGAGIVPLTSPHEERRMKRYLNAGNLPLKISHAKVMDWLVDLCKDRPHAEAVTPWTEIGFPFGVPFWMKDVQTSQIAAKIDHGQLDEVFPRRDEETKLKKA